MEFSHHMPIPWQNMVESDSDCPAVEASLQEKTTLIGRIGLMTLSFGTSAWRVRRSLNIVSHALGLSCTADIGLLTLELTCFDEESSCTQAYSLRTTGVNTDKMNTIERLIREFPEKAKTQSVQDFYRYLDELEKRPGNYSSLLLGLGAAMACCGFTFLLGGGLPEMICAFLGAGAGQYVRSRMLHRRITLLWNLICGVTVACLVYVASITLAEHLLHIPDVHEAGYICAMLFVIPGFPLITGGIDLAKLDMRSGLERLAYALQIIIVATLTGYAIAFLLQFRPELFTELHIQPVLHIFLRLIASFAGVFGFSMMFNSPPKMAAIAGCVGMVANTLRLELVDFAGLPAGIAAFVGALTAGLLAAPIYRKVGFPRLTLTVPSIVIMVPGLYLYRSIYYLGLGEIAPAAEWMAGALLIILALPLGLILARILTDSYFRHST